MYLTDSQFACALVFGPLMAGSLALAFIHAAIEIHTQRASRRAWTPSRKDRRHG